jgi:hypothetical protein
MDPVRLLHPLCEPPREVYEWTDAAAEFDAVTYRLGLRLLVPVPGLPHELIIGDVRASVLTGPVLAQHTNLRQRYGFPIVFDKYMTREHVGDGELILLLSIEHTVSDITTVEQSVLRWRATAEGAAGTLAAVLDERTAGDSVFEDVVLLRAGETVGAADVRARVRSFLPLEVTSQDRAGLERLADIELEGSGVGRAARLLRRAALEGPTADAYVMLFVAAESVLDSRQPSKREFDEVLREAGFNPDGLPLHAGLLISLRGQIVHDGLEDHERLRMAYYEMEAIVRVLIRRAAGIEGGWWPAHGSMAYSTDYDARVHAQQGHRTQWHADGLPPMGTATEERIPRKVPSAAEKLVVRLHPSLVQSATEEQCSMISAIVADAQAWVDPDRDPITVLAGSPPDATDPADITFNADEIWLAESRLDGMLDEDRPEVLVNLAWDLHGAVGGMLLMRAGVASEGAGMALIEAAGALHQYTRLITHGEFAASALNLPSANDAYGVGKVAGWAAAGDRRAKGLLSRKRGRNGKLGRKLFDLLTDQSPFPPRPTSLVATEP